MPQDRNVPRFQRTAAQTARVNAHLWQLIAAALSAEQFSDDARAAVKRLDEQVHQFAIGNTAGGLPAVLIESTLQLITDMGGIAIHIGNQQFAMVGAQRDAAHVGVDGNNSGDGHGAVSSGTPSVAESCNYGGTA